MPLTIACPDCGGASTYAGNDERGAIYTCESSAEDCEVFDHWRDDVRTYRGTHRGGYEGFGSED